METAVHFLLSMNLAGLLHFFWFYFIFELPRYTFSSLAVGWRAAFAPRRSLPSPQLPVSVLLAGHNEGGKLDKAVTGLKEQTHRNLQIVVVDDGSTDETREVGGRLLAGGHIDKFVSSGLRGGKAAALNLGLQYCRHEMVVVMDIDTSLDRDAIAQAVAPLVEEPEVGAVSGALGVRNPDDSVLAQLQAIEYTLTIVIGRQFAALFDILTIVSGAFGAFRRSGIEMVGGWDVGPGDDSNLTTKLRRAGWRIEFAPEAWALTDVPTVAGKFMKQRLRWNRSIIRNRFRKFRNVFNPMSAQFRGYDVLATLNVLWFHVGLSFSFVFYIIHIFSTYPEIAWTIIIAVHILTFAGDLIEFSIAAIFVRRLSVLTWLPYLPLYMVFTTYFKRAIRLLAYTSELVFRTSYTDPFYPQKVRAAQDQF